MIKVQGGNEGANRLVVAIRDQAKKIFDNNNQTNTLGTVTPKGIYLDSVEDIIPKNDFLYLQTGETLKNGDRIMCAPVGDYFVVLGKVK